MTVQASPGDLAEHARRVAQLGIEVHRTAGMLAPALDRLRAATGSQRAVGGITPVDVELRALADRLTSLAQVSGGVAERLRRADDGSAVTLSVWDGGDRAALLGVVGALLRHHAGPTTTFEPHRWARSQAGRAALAEARELLRDRFGGVRRDDVDAFERLLTGLPGPLADAVVAGLDDAALQRLVTAVHGGRWGVGRSLDERHRLWTAIGSRVSLPTFRRVVALTDDLDPDPRLAEDLEQVPRLVADGLIPHERWYQELVYAERPGHLSWRGDDDPHAFAPSDVTQGMLGNCYLVAAMISAARLRPERLQAMFTEHPSGAVTVRFADGVEVTVTPDLPVHPAAPETPAFVGNRVAGHRDVPAGQHELWPKLLEKAVAQRTEGGWGRAASGVPGAALQALLGGRHQHRRVVSDGGRPLPRREQRTDVGSVRRDLAAGRSVIVATLHPEARSPAAARAQEQAPADQRITAGHAYTLLDLDADGTATLRDSNHPPDQVQRVAWDDMLDLAIYVDVNDLEP